MEQELVTTEAKGPPLPKWAYMIVNPLMRGVLRSPVHGLLSGALMTISFRGRRSGRRYTIPVGYMEEDGKLYLFSHAAWAKNFRGSAPVTVRLRGQERRGTARIVEDMSVILRFLRRMVAERGENMASRMGFAGAVSPGLRPAQDERPHARVRQEVEYDLLHADVLGVAAARDGDDGCALNDDCYQARRWHGY